MLRLDLFIDLPVTMWSFQAIPDTSYFLWRELEHAWLDHHRVGDPIHVIGGHHVGVFDRVAHKNHFERRTGCLHCIYDDFAREIPMGRIAFLLEGFYNSNPKEIPNPIYRINRGIYS